MSQEAEIKAKAEAPNASFKEQLDRKADEAQEPSQNNDNAVTTNTVNPIIKKVTEYIPATKSVLGDPQDEKEKTGEEEAPPSEPPERPIHDDKIEALSDETHPERRGGDNAVCYHAGTEYCVRPSGVACNAS
ncbi:hypothetical protein SODALDRAFT_378256 [Sodiomyces alkalinus F11]|uniref:Uncharacterized protein n=1 Tax=Sodiomyces alkalinus (strain CBS 110278 / VKM F-3762 / F11) TaxID=1314773 RepID=A0A3N2PXS4_SODAK|nr:hypothetical protein SODALDRAFT_378256 [Sodiomyces alkalinus F11]ROT39145.1 hypothetical protein SODALDRAFT_378256 [Sodiomyces alkalinus F11]